MSQNMELFGKAFRALFRGTWIWTGVLVVLIVSVVSVWPSLEESGSLSGLTEGLSPELVAAMGMEQFDTPLGYLRGNLYALILPLLIGAMIIAQTTTLTAGDEADGRMELLLALPVSRWRVYLARFLAIVVTGALVMAVATVMTVSSVMGFDMDVPTEGIVAAGVALWVFAIAHGAIAFAVAGLGGGRGAAMGTAVGVLVVGYLMDAILPMARDLQAAGDWSPWSLALGDDPLGTGEYSGTLGVLVAVAVVLVGVGTVAVTRRDVRSA